MPACAERSLRSQLRRGVIALLLVGASAASCTTLDDVTAPSCTYSASPGSASFGTAGGSGSLNVTAAGVCAWTVINEPSWITIKTGRSGSGNGEVTYTVAANASPAERTASLSIASATVNITQTAPPCTFVVDPPSVTIEAAGASGIISVLAGAGCAWSATSQAPWISIASGATGAGSGTVAYAVSANMTGIARSAAIAVAGRTVAVSQSK